MNGQIGHGHFFGASAEQRGELLVDAVEALRPRSAAVGLRAEVERVNRGALIVGREQCAVGTERHRSDRGERRPLAGLDRLQRR